MLSPPIRFRTPCCRLEKIIDGNMGHFVRPCPCCAWYHFCCFQFFEEKSGIFDEFFILSVLTQSHIALGVFQCFSFSQNIFDGARIVLLYSNAGPFIIGRSLATNAKIHVKCRNLWKKCHQWYFYLYSFYGKESENVLMAIDT